MPKFTLIAEHTNFTGETLQKNTLEFEEDYISDVLDNIKQFLQGTGFVIDGSLDIVPDNFADYSEPEQSELDFTFKQPYYKEVKIND